MAKTTKSVALKNVLAKLTAMRATLKPEEQEILDGIVTRKEEEGEVEAHANKATKNLATKNLATKNLATKNLATKNLSTASPIFDSESGEYKIP